MRFTDPFYLLLLIPILVGLAFSYRHVHGMAKPRKRLAFAIRVLLACLLVGALAGPQGVRPNRGTATLFLLDRSDSVTEADRRQAEEFVAQAVTRMGPDDASGLIVFGADARMDLSPGTPRPPGRILSVVDGTASDLAAALRLAMASFPDGKARRIVLISDGNETRGDAIEASEAAAAEGIPIHHVALRGSAEGSDVVVGAVQTPSEVRAYAPFDIRVAVESTSERRGELVLDRDGQIVRRIPVRIAPGRSTLVASDRLTKPGFYRYRATLRVQGDRDPRNNVGVGFASVVGKPRVLVLQGPDVRSPLGTVLRQGGLEVDVRGIGGVPSRPEALQSYDGVVLNDFNAGGMTLSQMRALRTAVRDGGLGLAMIGGENSFLPGGWYGTPVAEALPVDLDIRQRKTFPSTSILIVIDCSGSMQMMEDGVQKLRLAAKAAEETVKLMSPMDRVGVAGSTDGIEFVAPIQPLTDKGRVISQIRRIDVTGGGIYIGPSLMAAERELRKETTQVRHLILMADGNDSTDWRDALVRAATMRTDKITTSVVSIGRGKDTPMLRRLAQIGGGRFYIAQRAAQLPALVTQDAAIMSRSAIEEGAFVPKVASGDEVLRGVADGGLPPLLAYCLTDRRPLSRISMATGKDDPLMATWQFGLGNALAFTSDAQPRWAQQWVDWEGFGTFWSQAIRSIVRRAPQNAYQVRVEPEGARAKVVVTATDALGNPLDRPTQTVRLATPNGGFEELRLDSDAPGVYSGTFDANELGTYLVTVAEPDGRGGRRVRAAGFAVPYPPEYRTVRPNAALLQRVSAASGGQALTDPAALLPPVRRPGESISDLWAAFLLAAALLFPLDVAVRRLALPIAEAWAKLLTWLAARRHARTAPVTTATATAVAARLEGVRRKTPNEPASPLIPSAPTASERPAPAPPRNAPGSTAATGLLEAKRKRQAERRDSETPK